MSEPVGGAREFALSCFLCGQVAEFPAYGCAQCSGPLVMNLADLASGPGTATASEMRAGAGGIWKHRHLLPRTRAAISLGEGSTPLVPFVSDTVQGKGFTYWLKSEHLNPTLSFKDRAMALGVSAALDLGCRGLVLASTGNAAASAAAYAAAAGLPCRIFCGTGSGAGGKLALARAFGAEVHVVDGDYSTAYAAAAAAEEDGWLNVSTTYRNPILAEGYRTIAAELIDDLGAVPDAVVVPVGAGPLLRGIRKGFLDLTEAGAAQPKLIAVQASACAPLAEAWLTDDWLTDLRRSRTFGTTAATAIADALRGYETQGLITLSDVRESGGAVVAVNEQQIAAAGLELRKAGHYVEPASATSLAALRTDTVSALLPDGATVVLMLTGHGAKDAAPQLLSDPGAKV